MLAQLEQPTNDFAALARYLVEGRARPTDPARVAWIMPWNLGTDDPMRAARLMAATAERSKRCRHACHHAIIAWAPDERPTPEQMQEIARATLTMAGLGEHQALVMGHGDKPHAHLHMMINRVHPETGRAWSTAHDWRRFDRIMRDLAAAHGFRAAPAHAFNPEPTDDLPKGPGKRATWAARRGAATGRMQWSRRRSRELGARISERLDAAANWNDVIAALAEDGLALEPKGKGHVIGDAAGYAKLSALGLTAAAKAMMRGRATMRARPGPASVKPVPFPRRSGPPHAARHPRRGASFRPARPLWAVDAIDIARVLGTRADLRRAIQDAAGARKARLARRPVIEQLLGEMVQQWRSATALKAPARRRKVSRRAPPAARPRPEVGARRRDGRGGR